MSNILIIEDDPLVSEAIAYTLQRSGHAVAVARNGITGLALAADAAPDLVITDMFMPESDGMEVVRTLRAKSDELPILAISGGGRTGNLMFLEFAEKMGACTVLAKPFTNKALVSTVHECLAQRHAA